MRLLASAAAVALLAIGSAVASDAATSGRFQYAGTVTGVVDGDTLDVRLASGRAERIRLIGIDTPERGACYFSQAGARARTLALGRSVTLRGDPTQDTRDRYGRLLAYVDIGRTDLGAALIREGYGKVYVYSRPFVRLAAYRTAEAAAKGATRGSWKACGAKAAPVPVAGTGCHPSYSNCLPIVSDLDCADVRRLGKAPVRVLGSDPYRLDGDGDGFGCE